MPDPATQQEDESLNLQVTSIDSDSEPSLNLAAVKQALVDNPVSVLLGDLILNGWPDSCKELEQELKPYWIHRFNLSLMEGVILLGEDHIVVPVSLLVLHLIVKLSAQDSSMVLTLVRLTDIHTLLLWITTHLHYLNAHYPHLLQLW